MINTGKFANKTVLITGGSRGIGKAIALKIARDGANVVIASKTVEPHPKLDGTIFTAAKEIESVGGKCLPIQCDLRDEQNVANAIEQTVKQFGGIDVLVNNASAISMTNTEQTSMKKYDLMHQINIRGTFMASKYAIPYLKKSSNAHILNLSPPLVMDQKWFAGHVAYTMAKYGMSMCVLGMASELKDYGIAVNALWPRTAIWTAAMNMLVVGDMSKNLRKPDILSDSAYAILSRDSKSYTGNFCIDEDVLREEGITDFDQYAVSPGNSLIPDFFLPDKYLEGFDLDLKNLSVVQPHQQQQQQATDSASADKTAKIFEGIKLAISEDLQKEINAVLSFVVSGQSWLIDANISRPLKVERAEATNPDVTLIMDDETFLKMVKGDVKATNAFMSGKLKIKGNIAVAMKAEKLFGRLKAKL